LCASHSISALANLLPCSPSLPPSMHYCPSIPVWCFKFYLIYETISDTSVNFKNTWRACTPCTSECHATSFAAEREDLPGYLRDTVSDTVSIAAQCTCTRSWSPPAQEGNQPTAMAPCLSTFPGSVQVQNCFFEADAGKELRLLCAFTRLLHSRINSDSRIFTVPLSPFCYCIQRLVATCNDSLPIHSI